MSVSRVAERTVRRDLHTVSARGLPYRAAECGGSQIEGGRATRRRILRGRCVERGQRGGAEARGAAVRSMDSGTQENIRRRHSVARGAAILMGSEGWQLRGTSERFPGCRGADQRGTMRGARSGRGFRVSVMYRAPHGRATGSRDAAGCRSRGSRDRAGSVVSGLRPCRTAIAV